MTTLLATLRSMATLQLMLPQAAEPTSGGLIPSAARRLCLRTMAPALLSSRSSSPRKLRTLVLRPKATTGRNHSTTSASPRSKTGGCRMDLFSTLSTRPSSLALTAMLPNTSPSTLTSPTKSTTSTMLAPTPSPQAAPRLVLARSSTCTTSNRWAEQPSALLNSSSNEPQKKSALSSIKYLLSILFQFLYFP